MTHVFQMGWFNHQPDKDFMVHSVKGIVLTLSCFKKKKHKMARMFYMISIDLGVSGATMGGRKTMQTLSQKVN